MSLVNNMGQFGLLQRCRIPVVMATMSKDIKGLVFNFGTKWSCQKGLAWQSLSHRDFVLRSWVFSTSMSLLTHRLNKTVQFILVVNIDDKFMSI